MKKSLLFILVLALCFALPVFAQDDTGEAQDMAMAPPPAIDNKLLKSFVGEWQGKTEGAMGTTQDKLSYQLGLDGQFLTMQMEAKGEHNMTGMGAITLKDGKLKGYWIDNYRTMAEGEGMIEGNKISMTWKSADGMKYISTDELVDENTIKSTAKMEMPDGSVMESTSEYTRSTKEMTDKM